MGLRNAGYGLVGQRCDKFDTLRLLLQGDERVLGMVQDGSSDWRIADQLVFEGAAQVELLIHLTPSNLQHIVLMKVVRLGFF